MLDFTSALYLGMGHARSCGSWPSLTTGVPAALRVPPEAREVERGIETAIWFLDEVARRGLPRRGRARRTDAEPVR